MKLNQARLRRLLGRFGTVGFGLAALQALVFVAYFAFGRFGCGMSNSLADSIRGQASGVDNALTFGKPANDLDELLGAPLPKLPSGQLAGCWSEWTDEEPVYTPPGPGGGPKNGFEIAFWKALTFRGHTTVGKYVGDLWLWTSAGTGAVGFPSAGSQTANQRLVERLPPPGPPPPGFRAIQPGECVAASLDEDRERVIGRFVIDLPAPRSVGVSVDYPVQLDVKVKKQLRYGDAVVPGDCEEIGTQEAPECRPNGHFRVSHAGRHQVLLYRTDQPGTVPPAQTHGKIYTMQVEWGTSVTYACHPEHSLGDSCF